MFLFRLFQPALGLSILALAAVNCAAQQQPKGVPARSSPDDYPARVSVDGVTFAAAALSPDQIKHTFAFDISKYYVVFEVAIYPGMTTPTIDADGFVVRTAAKSEAVRRSDPVTVASANQQKNLPRDPSRWPTVVAATSVGYESGRDPCTGRPVHGTYTSTQVGVGIGDDGAPRYPSPGGYPQDRELLERQLWEKSLPEGRLVHPAAGYLYFPASLLKKKSGNAYQMEYLGASGDDTAAQRAPSEKVRLDIPAKAR